MKAFMLVLALMALCTATGERTVALHQCQFTIMRLADAVPALVPSCVYPSLEITTYNVHFLGLLVVICHGLAGLTQGYAH